MLSSIIIMILFEKYNQPCELQDEKGWIVVLGVLDPCNLIFPKFPQNSDGCSAKNNNKGTNRTCQIPKGREFPNFYWRRGQTAGGQLICSEINLRHETNREPTRRSSRISPTRLGDAKFRILLLPSHAWNLLLKGTQTR